ncbi:SOS response-associated peptidase [Sorangium sp. So ce362]|uniref:SOS response-associated peptidase n=1 Tax=Sorangium sp. So ce362 TaxID=3133303 RepID=UPI003F62B547
MCARFTLAVPDFASLVAMLEAAVGAGAAGGGTARVIVADPRAAALYRPRYNIAPSTVHPVLRAQGGQRELVPGTWGFAGRFARGGAAPSLLANARAESARTKPTFRGAFAAHRCVVPADGFYEWTGPKGARRPTWFHPAGGGLLRLAGLYQPAKDPDTGELDLRFTILTTEASADVAPVHDRMPVLLEPEDVDLWLGAGEGADAERAEALLRPAPRGSLAARAVSPRVNSVGHDDPALLQEVVAEAAAPKASPSKAAAPKAGGTLPLFDLDRAAGPAVSPGRTPRR